MGRRKLEMKRIEDKIGRSVTFAKRRPGLFKKARQLSVLCDADVAVIIFSAGGKLYEFSSRSVKHILSRYHNGCLEAEEITNDETGEDLCKGFLTCKELLLKVDRLYEEDKPKELSRSVDEMTQLEQELDAALMHTRLRKTQLMMEYTSTLKEKGNKLSEEKQELEKQVAASAEENDVDGGGGLNDLATNQTTSPQLTTLHLFHG